MAEIMTIQGTALQVKEYADQRGGHVNPSSSYRKRLCEVLGLPEGYFDIRCRRSRAPGGVKCE